MSGLSFSSLSLKDNLKVYSSATKERESWERVSVREKIQVKPNLFVYIHIINTLLIRRAKNFSSSDL